MSKKPAGRKSLRKSKKRKQWQPKFFYAPHLSKPHEVSLDTHKTLELVKKLNAVELAVVCENAYRISNDQKREQKDRKKARAVLEGIFNACVRQKKFPKELDGYFTWPNTRAIEGDGSVDANEWVKEGVPSYFGYHVWRTHGECEDVRRRILQRIFEDELPAVFPPDYLNSWAKPGSAARLNKLAMSLASHARNRKRQQRGNWEHAVEEWEADLDFLFHKYYVGKFNFAWPRTDI